MQAIIISNLELFLRLGGRWLRREEISSGPKKKDLWSRSLGLVVWRVSLESSSCSYSRWTCVMRGGFLAFKRCRCHTGVIDGVGFPCAISFMAFRNWIKPYPSHMVWFKRRARMNPPHSKRVTCKIKDVGIFKLLVDDADKY